MPVVDTSVAIATVVAAHPDHDRCWDVVTRHQPSIAGHASIEAFSVLTRLPVVDRVSSHEARALLRSNFAAVVWPGAKALEAFLDRCDDAGITGGAVYDALVALAVVATADTLLTLDRRAHRTYAAMGVTFLSPYDLR